jgi:hypothetical protein
MSVLNLAGNAIGGCDDGYGGLVATPDGIDFILLCMHITLLFLSLLTY